MLNAVLSTYNGVYISNVVTFSDLVDESGCDEDDGESVLHGTDSDSTEVYCDWEVERVKKEHGEMSASTDCCSSAGDSDLRTVDNEKVQHWLSLLKV